MLTWPRLLEEEEVLRGRSYYGSGRGLHRLAAKLLAGQPVKIVAIGGSVTAWAGGDPAGEVRGYQVMQRVRGCGGAAGPQLGSQRGKGRTLHGLQSWPCRHTLRVSSSTSTTRSRTRRLGQAVLRAGGCKRSRRSKHWGTLALQPPLPLNQPQCHSICLLVMQ